MREREMNVGALRASIKNEKSCVCPTMLTMLFVINHNTKDLIIHHAEQLVNCHVKLL